MSIIMNNVFISATNLKNNVADILTNVYFYNRTTVVKRYGKPIAKIIPYKADVAIKNDMDVDKYFGILPDFPIPKRKFNHKVIL